VRYVARTCLQSLEIYTPIPGPSPEFEGREKSSHVVLKSLPEFGEGYREG
jgi:hypothetical protein